MWYHFNWVIWKCAVQNFSTSIVYLVTSKYQEGRSHETVLICKNKWETQRSQVTGTTSSPLWTIFFFPIALLILYKMWWNILSMKNNELQLHRSHLPRQTATMIATLLPLFFTFNFRSLAVVDECTHLFVFALFFSWASVICMSFKHRLHFKLFQ